MKRISKLTADYLRDQATDLLDGVVTVVHGQMLEMLECQFVGVERDRTMWVVNVTEVDGFYGPEDSDAIRAAEWVTAVCFEDKSEAMLWFTNNVHKRLLMRDMHDQDLMVFLMTVPEQLV